MINRNLKQDISTAIAWGIPDTESTGYTAAEFTGLLRRALNRINYLETTLKENNVQFTQTDYEDTKTS